VRIAVVGAGVVGLAAAYELVRDGHEVRCFEAARPMGARSAGDTRIFRLAHASPGLVDWAARARRGWDAWSRAAGAPLVGPQGTVVSGEIAAMAEAMAAAGAPHRVTGDAPPVPAVEPVGPFLVDPGGGAIQAAAAGRHLLGVVGSRVVHGTVTALDPAGAVVAGEPWRCDSVLLAAGAATPALAGQVGIAVPAAVEHHARFTYELRDPAAAPPCWLDRSAGWRPGFTSYGHLAGPGRWAVGGHLPAALTSPAVDRADAVAAARAEVGGYAAHHLTGVRPEPVDTLYCDPMAGAGDGIHAVRSGAVLAVWGNNLFKFAPLLGQVLATAATALAVPALPS
jgi:sarcosine oxidase